MTPQVYFMISNSILVFSELNLGFLHVHMGPWGQRLCGIHFGDERFAFRGMPFGVPRSVLKILSLKF